MTTDEQLVECDQSDWSLTDGEQDALIQSLVRDDASCVHNFAPAFRLIEQAMRQRITRAWGQGWSACASRRASDDNPYGPHIFSPGRPSGVNDGG